MERRRFLSTLIGGVAAAAAVRTFPFRVFSFPKEIIVPSHPCFSLNDGIQFDPSVRVEVHELWTREHGYRKIGGGPWKLIELHGGPVPVVFFQPHIEHAIIKEEVSINEALLLLHA